MPRTTSAQRAAKMDARRLKAGVCRKGCVDELGNPRRALCGRGGRCECVDAENARKRERRLQRFAQRAAVEWLVATMVHLIYVLIVDNQRRALHVGIEPQKGALAQNQP